MTATQSRLLGVALLLAAISAVMGFANGSDPVDAASDRAGVAAATNQPDQAVARAKARFEEGAYVLRSKQLSDHEEIKLIVIPEGTSEELDTRCVVYQNSESGTSTMTCSGIKFRQAAP